MRPLRPVLAVLASLLLLPSAASAAEQTTGFEDLAPGTTVTNQYASSGLLLGTSPAGTAGTPARVSTPASGGYTASGTKLAEISSCQNSAEFGSCTTDLWIKFTVPQSQIALFLGFARPTHVSASTPVTMVALDAAQSQISSTTKTVGPGAKTLFTAGTITQKVTYLHITNFTNSGNGAQQDQLGLDDISYDVPAGGPPAATPDFGFARTDGAGQLTVRGGQSVSLPLKVARFDGSTGPITFSVPDLPPGVEVSWAPAATSSPGDGAAITATFTATSPAAPSSSTITVLATPGSAAGAAGPRQVAVPLVIRGSDDLSVVGIWPVQAVNALPATAGATVPGAATAYNGTTLVAGMRTVVRVYARASASSARPPAPGDSGVLVRLTGSRDGVALPGSPLSPETVAPVLSHGDLASQQGGQSAYEFTLPPTWAQGDVALSASIADSTGGIIIADDPRAVIECESCKANNTSTLTGLRFVPTQPLVITPVPAFFHDLLNKTKAEPDGVLTTTKGTSADASDRARLLFPVSDANWQMRPYTSQVDLSDLTKYTYEALATKQGDLVFYGDHPPKTAVPAPTGEDSQTGAKAYFAALKTTLETARDSSAYSAAKLKADPDLSLQQSTIAAAIVDPKSRLRNKYADGGDFKNEGAWNVLQKWQQQEVTNAGKVTTGALTIEVATRIPRGLSGNTKFVLGGKTVSYPLAVVDPNRPLTSVAHEIGHAVGRLHSDKDCGGPAGGGSDTDWPEGRGQLLAGDLGIDPSVRSAPGATYQDYLSPTADFMSYCADIDQDVARSPSGPWVSTKGWLQELAYTQVAPVPIDAGTGLNPVGGARSAHAAARGRAVVGPGILVRAFAATSHGLNLTGTEPASGVRPAQPTRSAYVGSLVDARGRTIGSAPLAVADGHSDPSPGHPGELVQSVTGVVPSNGKAVAGLVVRRGRRVVARRRASRHAPTLTVRTPKAKRDGTVSLRWKAKDKDRDRLSLDVDVSKDGRHWKVLYVGPSRTGITVPAEQVPASRKARIRVRVNDGFRAVRKTSRPFTSRGAAPSLRVGWPTQGARVAAGGRVYGAVRAFDDRGTALNGEAITWYDGSRRVARGHTVSIAGLRPGRHRLRVVARDTRGRHTTKRVTVRVVRP